MHVQSYLLDHSLADLARDHGVNAGLSADGCKVSLTYDPIDAREDDPLACQCRGVVLARADHAPFDEGVVGPTRVLARPFDRFFNHGQRGADAGELLARPGTRVLEKYDGTLCIVYFDDHQGRWHVATRSVPEADKLIGGFAGTTDRPMAFRDLFERALEEAHGLVFAAFTAHLNPTVTYLFELTTPFNLVGVPYPTCAAVLLGARRRDGAELDPREAAPTLPTPTAAAYPCDSLEAVRAFIAARPGSECEGVVLVGADFARMKVKHPDYRSQQSVTEPASRSPRRLLELILAERHDDLFPLLAPQIRAEGERMRELYANAAHTLDEAYARLRAAHPGAGREDRAAFARAVQAESLPIDPLMARFADRCTGYRHWVDTHRQPDGAWPDVFLDHLLRLNARWGARDYHAPPTA